MAERIVTDAAGRKWTCSPQHNKGDDAQVAGTGRDVTLSCTTDSVDGPVAVTVGWQWESMSDNGLARLISQASPPPRT
jgi:hypothetical protein